MTEPPPLTPRNARALLVIGFAAAIAFLTVSVGGDSGMAWLGRGEAAWIVYPQVARTSSHPVRPLEASFTRELRMERESTGVVDLRCLGQCVVELDGRAFGAEGGGLHAGLNQITVRARRADGPPTFSLVLRDGRDGPIIVESDTRWTVSLDGSVPLRAVLATDPMRLPAVAAPDIPRAGLVGLVLLGIALSLGAERYGVRARRALPALVALAWLALLVRNRASLPGFVGFDVEHHLFYLRFLLERGNLPSPSAGVQTYQPPLFYLLSAGWLRLLGLAPEGAAGVAALRTLTFGLVLGHVLGLYACVRLLLPGRDAAAALALVFAAAAPLHLASFHAFSNETLVAALSTASLYALLRVLRSDDPTATHGLVVGTLVGAAVLAKLSALVLVPIALGALLVHRPRSWAAPAALLSIVLVAGWYYAGVAREFGTPFIGNWDERVGFAWWQDPGVRDAGAYLRFGRALQAPWFAGFASVWDGAYSTFFADGLASGEPSRLLGPPWNHGLVRVAVWLGLIPTALVALGAAMGLVRVWRRPDASGLALLGLAVAMLSAFLFMTLRVPSYAQAKAIYLSPGLVVGVVALALGADAVWRRSPVAGRVVSAAMLVWAVVSFSVFWIDADAPGTLRSRGERALASGDPALALALFESAATSRPEGAPVWSLVGGCRAHLMAGRPLEAARECSRALERSPNDADALFHSASVARRSGGDARALALLDQLRAVAPLDERAPPRIAKLAERLGRPRRAAAAAREWLRFDPGNPAALGVLRRTE